MAMKNLGYVDLPEHRGNGGFDHAAVHNIGVSQEEAFRDADKPFWRQ